MKISGLLTSFLYQNRKLNIPGIGQFTIPETVAIPEPEDKNFAEFLQYVQFTPKNILQPDTDLIDYIRKETGKIKPLAESDLESYLADCKSLLNIGKPLFLEGIGTLQKNKIGGLDFLAGQPLMERVESHEPEKAAPKHGDRKFLYNNEYTNQSSQGGNLRKLLIVGGALFGLAVVVWGGYLLYARNVNQTDNTIVTSVTNPETEADTTANTQQPPVLQPDSLAKDSVNPALPVLPDSASGQSPLVSYKFILQTTSKKYIADSNYNKIKNSIPDVHLISKDSSTYQIYVIKKCLPSDTTKEKTNLNNWYWGRKEMRVRIEL